MGAGRFAGVVGQGFGEGRAAADPKLALGYDFLCILGVPRHLHEEVRRATDKYYEHNTSLYVQIPKDDRLCSQVH